MANQTPNKGLTLPISTERYSVDVFNKNNQIIDAELHNLDEKNTEQDNKLSSIQEDLSGHKNNNNNPHKVTASQIGLGKVENKSSEDIRNELTSDNVTGALGYTPYTPAEIDDKFSANVIPKATDEVDGLLSKEDHSKYDDANAKKHVHDNKFVLDGITADFISSLIKGIPGGIPTLDSDCKIPKEQLPNDIGFPVDTQLDNTSENPVQNKVIASEIEMLKKSVSDGKSLVAGAITNKGVQTAADATFQQMATNVGSIKTTPNLQEKLMTTEPFNDTYTYIKPDSGYDGLSSVGVPVLTKKVASKYFSNAGGISTTPTYSDFTFNFAFGMAGLYSLYFLRDDGTILDANTALGAASLPIRGIYVINKNTIRVHYVETISSGTLYVIAVGF